MKNWIKRDWLLLLVLAAPFVFIALVWDRIPERMPIHFDASFRPNGWMRKPWAPLLLPLTGVAVVLFSTVLFHFDPKMAKYDEDTRLHVKRVLRNVMLALALFIGVCSVTLIWAAWGDLRPVVYSLTYGLPLMLMVTGNGLGKLKPNYTIGIRLPWTLESPSVWTKTHRLGGRLLVGISAALLVLAITQWQKEIYTWILVGCLLAWALVVTGYAFVISRQERGQSQTVA